MPDFLPDFLHAFLQGTGTWILTWWMHSTLLIGGVWVLFKFRPQMSPALQERLWKTALVGAFLTATVQTAGWWRSPFAISLATARSIPAAKETPSDPRVELLPALVFHNSLQARDAGLPEVERVRLPLKIARQEIPAEATSAKSGSVATSPLLFPNATSWSTVTSWFTVPAWLTWAWLSRLAGCVSMAFLTFGLIRWGKHLSALFAETRTQQLLTAGTAVEVLAELQHDARYRRTIRLMVTAGEEEPGAAGWLQPTITLPQRALDELSRAELKSLLAHELAHLVRRDPLWLAGTFLVQLAFPFQPLLWPARRRWQQVAEVECDALAVEWTADPIALAECLTRVLSWKLPPNPSLVVATLSQGAELSRRVESLLEDPVTDPWRSGRWRRLLWPLSGVLLLGVTLLGPQVTGILPLPRTFAADEPKAEQSSAAVDNKRITVDEFAELQKEIALLKQELEAVNQTAFSIPPNNIEQTAEQQQRFAELLARFAKMKAIGNQFVQKGERLPRSVAELLKEIPLPQPPREHNDAPVDDRRMP
ncbi:MAG: M56 family metallopeptidase [Planctomycetales bacterium]